jgi:hypothetical protein
MLPSPYRFVNDPELFRLDLSLDAPFENVHGGTDVSPERVSFLNGSIEINPLKGREFLTAGERIGKPIDALLAHDLLRDRLGLHVLHRRCRIEVFDESVDEGLNDVVVLFEDAGGDGPVLLHVSTMFDRVHRGALLSVVGARPRRLLSVTPVGCFLGSARHDVTSSLVLPIHPIAIAVGLAACFWRSAICSPDVGVHGRHERTQRSRSSLAM